MRNVRVESSENPVYPKFTSLKTKRPLATRDPRFKACKRDHLVREECSFGQGHDARSFLALILFVDSINDHLRYDVTLV